ncbi:Type II secretion system (T2SS), protein F [Asaccharospora irregularis DSM 2635]|uniref:Type II secretion system (T2SS), protein F n=1 Tax=Asaccharospora irregularis DSM 2635 TaxID=1121321 RepID=A0A1M5QHD0_9FIRM|nr:Type II secretion system (T2SS), protein F [Asaccharospora irregularis DSM 2635]
MAERALIKARDGIVKGESLGSSLAESKYFDSLLVQMVSIGEQTGELESITNQMAEFYEQESEVYLNRLVAMVEPTMIILVGILVGILVASIFLPMISMYDAL